MTQSYLSLPLLRSRVLHGSSPHDGASGPDVNAQSHQIDKFAECRRTTGAVVWSVGVSLTGPAPCTVALNPLSVLPPHAVLWRTLILGRERNFVQPTLHTGINTVSFPIAARRVFYVFLMKLDRKFDNELTMNLQ